MEEKIVVVQYTCLKCGHKWVPRRPVKPRVCPNCKRFDWQEERKVKR